MIFGGFKYTLDMYKAAHDLSSTDHDKGTNHLNRNRIGHIPDWALKLDWKNDQTIPGPYKEISMEEWILAGICGGYSPQQSFYAGLHIPGEFEWFGGWACDIHLYPFYGLVNAHMHSYDPIDESKVALGKGHRIRRDEYITYTIRYFKIGCDHKWKEVPEESRMCLHTYICTKCGMKNAVDSSD